MRRAGLHALRDDLASAAVTMGQFELALADPRLGHSRDGGGVSPSHREPQARASAGSAPHRLRPRGARARAAAAAEGDGAGTGGTGPVADTAAGPRLSALAASRARASLENGDGPQATTASRRANQRSGCRAGSSKPSGLVMLSRDTSAPASRNGHGAWSISPR